MLAYPLTPRSEHPGRSVLLAADFRQSHVLTQDEKVLVAYHEAGHAIVAVGAGMKTGVQKLSIVARGRSLGHTTTYQISDRLVLTRTDLLRQIVTTMGGVAIEQMVNGETTTGSEGDLRSAKSLARAMVATWGMGDSLGRVAVGQKSGEVFLGRDFTKIQEVSQTTLEHIDKEIRQILETAEGHARSILEANRPAMEKIVALLLERETLSGAELREILDAIRPGGLDAPKADGTRKNNGSRRRGREVIELARPR
jgi:cell division protease FtsH